MPKLPVKKPSANPEGTRIGERKCRWCGLTTSQLHGFLSTACHAAPKHQPHEFVEPDDSNRIGDRLTEDLTNIDWSWTREDVARQYAQALAVEDVDWPRVNQAIIAQWSVSGLGYIKRRAWKLREAGEVRP